MDEVDNDELERLLSEGVPFVDVRTEEEFGEGHIPGARNVPVLLRGQNGAEWEPNPDFLRVIQAHFPKSKALAIGCASGVRSRHARALLARDGYTQLYHLTGGFKGGRDPFGAKICGWLEADKPSTREPAKGASYADLRAAVRAHDEL